MGRFLPLLGFSLDFIIVWTFVSLANIFLIWVTEYAISSDLSWYLETAFSFVIVLMVRQLGWSAGEFLLGYAKWETETGAAKRLWPNLVLGTLLILSSVILISLDSRRRSTPVERH